MGMMVAFVANLRHHFRTEGELAHDWQPALGSEGHTHALAIQSSYGHSASLSRREYSLAPVARHKPRAATGELTPRGMHLPASYRLAAFFLPPIPHVPQITIPAVSRLFAVVFPPFDLTIESPNP